MEYVVNSGFVFSHEQEDYTMNMKANRAKEIRVSFKANLKIGNISMRPLRWIAASLVCHDTDVANCCVYYINSFQEISADNKAKLKVDDGKILFREGEVLRVAEKYQENVTLVRHKKARVYKKGGVEAWISKINTYEDFKSPTGSHPTSSHVEFDFFFGDLTANHGHDYAFINNFWQAGLDFLRFLKLKREL